MLQIEKTHQRKTIPPANTLKTGHHFVSCTRLAGQRDLTIFGYDNTNRLTICSLFLGHWMEAGACQRSNHVRRMPFHFRYDCIADSDERPDGPLSFEPSCSVFHYAHCLFEGLKAYRRADERVTMFRPDMHMTRMNASAARITLPVSTLSSVRRTNESSDFWYTDLTN